jgi:hypothetical protein
MSDKPKDPPPKPRKMPHVEATVSHEQFVKMSRGVMSVPKAEINARMDNIETGVRQ